MYDDIGNPTHIGYCDDGYWNEHYELTWQGRQLMSYVYSEEGGEDIRFAYNAEGIRTKKVSKGVEHNYILIGSQIIAETWTENNVEHLVYYLYDEVGSPIGIAYRTNNYGLVKAHADVLWGEGNNATGVGVADDAALAGLIPIFWTNIEILNAY